MNMKRITCIFITAILLLPAMRMTTAKVDGTAILHLEYGQLEDKLMQNNLAIQANKLSLESLVNSLNDLEDDKEDYEKDNQKQIDTINQQIAYYQQQLEALQPVAKPNQPGKEVSYDSTLYDAVNNSIDAVNISIAYIRSVYETNIQTFNQSIKQLSGSNGMDKQDIESQRLNLMNSILQLEKSNDQIVKEAQNLFLSYHYLSFDQEENAALLAVKESEQKILRLKRNLGMSKEEDLEAIETQIKDLNTALDSLQDQKDDILTQMNFFLGQDYETDLELGSLPAINPEELTMDYADDLKKTQDNSYSRKSELNNYQIQGIALNKAEDTHGEDSDEYREAEVNYKKAVLALSQKEQEWKNTFDRLYKDCIDKKAALSTEKTKLEESEKNYELVKLKFNLGMINSLEHENTRLQYHQQKLAVERSSYDLYKAYLEYQWMLKGLV